MSDFKFRPATLEILKLFCRLPIKWWTFMRDGNEEFKAGTSSTVAGFFLFGIAVVVFFLTYLMDELTNGVLFYLIFIPILTFDAARLLAYTVWYHIEGPGSEKRAERRKDDEPFRSIVVLFISQYVEQWRKALMVRKYDDYDAFFALYLASLAVVVLASLVVFVTNFLILIPFVGVVVTIDLLRYFRGSEA